jgi:hypothetical protein
VSVQVNYQNMLWQILQSIEFSASFLGKPIL